MILYLCVLIVFSLRWESLKLILAMNPFPRWFYHSHVPDVALWAASAPVSSITNVVIIEKFVIKYNKWYNTYE
jgi:hypothetical protein